jgi:hypothetical protein
MRQSKYYNDKDICFVKIVRSKRYQDLGYFHLCVHVCVAVCAYFVYCAGSHFALIIHLLLRPSQEQRLKFLKMKDCAPNL